MREKKFEKITKEELEQVNGGAVKADVYGSNVFFEVVINFVDSIKEKLRGND